MLANTERLIIGSSIANIYARDPFTARHSLRTLSTFLTIGFLLGLGVSHAPWSSGCVAMSLTSLADCAPVWIACRGSVERAGLARR